MSYYIYNSCTLFIFIISICILPTEQGMKRNICVSIISYRRKAFASLFIFTERIVLCDAGDSIVCLLTNFN